MVNKMEKNFDYFSLYGVGIFSPKRKTFGVKGNYVH